MSNDPQQQERNWLRDDPRYLLVLYRHIIATTVGGLVRRGLLPTAERDDMVEEIVRRLEEEELAKLARRYDGSAYLRTYFIYEVYQLALAYLQQQADFQPFDPTHRLKPGELFSLPPAETALLRDELRRLEGLLRSLPNRYRAELCLKCWARMPLQWSDISAYDNEDTRKTTTKMRSELFLGYENMSNERLCGLLAQLFSQAERKNFTAEHIDRWTASLRKHLIRAFNGEPAVATYDEDSFRGLLERYFS